MPLVTTVGGLIAGGTAAVTAELMDGDADEALVIRWMEDQSRRVDHIMQSGHAWDRLVDLSGNNLQDYQSIQPYIQQAVQSGAGRELGTTSPLGIVMEYVLTISGEEVIVHGVQVSETVFQISDAWVNTR